MADQQQQQPAAGAAGAEEAAAATAEGEDQFPAQFEDVNGDVVDLQTTDWKKVEETPLELDEEDDELEDGGAAAAGADGGAGGPLIGSGEGGEEDGEYEKIVVERDDSAQTLDGHGGEPVYALAVNPKSPNLVCTGGGDDNATLWDVLTGDRKFHFTGHTDSVTAVEFSKNGAYVATASYDSTIKIWRVEDGECIQTLEGPDGDVEWIAWHKNADVLLAGSKDATVWMWLAPSGKFMQVGAHWLWVAVAFCDTLAVNVHNGDFRRRCRVRVACVWQ